MWYYLTWPLIATALFLDFAGASRPLHEEEAVSWFSGGFGAHGLPLSGHDLDADLPHTYGNVGLLITETSDKRPTLSGTDQKPHDDGLPLSGHDLDADLTERHSAQTYSNVGQSAAWVLLGMITWVNTLLYLVNSPSTSVQRITWKTLASGLSLFLAILVSRTLRSTLDQILAQQSESEVAVFADSHGISHAHENTTDSTLIFLFCNFFIWFVLLEWTMFHTKSHPFYLRATSLIGSHAVGFQAGDAFCALLESEHFWHSLRGCFGITILAALVCGLISSAANIVRHKVSLWDGEVDKMEEAWLHQCEHVENDIMAFTFGLLNMETIRYIITGQILPHHGVQQNNNRQQVQQLLQAAFVLLLLVPVSSIPMIFVRDDWPRSRRVATILMETTSMSMGWTLLFAGRWLFWQATGNEGVLEGDVLISQLAMGAICMALSFSVIIICTKLAESVKAPYTEMAESLIEAFILLIGLSCEVAFETAVQEALPHYVSQNVKLHYKVLVCGFFCITMIPAFIQYILPKSLKVALHNLFNSKKSEIELRPWPIS